jgi:SulP family sulfate permease
LEEFVYHESTEEFWPEKEGKNFPHPHIRIVNVEGELFFGSTDLFQGTLRAIADDDTRTSAIIVRIKHVHDVDATTAIALKQLKSYLLQRNRHLIICSVPKQVISLLEKTNLITYLGKDNIIALDEHHPKVSLKLAWKRALLLLGSPLETATNTDPNSVTQPLPALCD